MAPSAHTHSLLKLNHKASMQGWSNTYRTTVNLRRRFQCRHNCAQIYAIRCMHTQTCIVHMYPGPPHSSFQIHSGTQSSIQNVWHGRMNQQNVHSLGNTTKPPPTGSATLCPSTPSFHCACAHTHVQISLISNNKNNNNNNNNSKQKLYQTCHKITPYE